MASKADVLKAMEETQAEVLRTVSAMPANAWSNRVYENGWTARDLLCHLVSSSNVCGFLLRLSRGRGPSVAEMAAMNIDEFNAQEVAQLSGRSVDQLAEDLKANIAEDAAVVRAASDEELAAHFRAPWGVEGALAGVMIGSLHGHMEEHLADLRRATG